MKISFDPGKTVVQNAARYYDEAKKLRAKARGAATSIHETKMEMQQLATTVEKAAYVRSKKKAQWFDKFLHFKTSQGSLVVAGRNAKQNDLLYSKHAAPEELFFHADIRGSPAVILKSAQPTEQELTEAAQFTACYSSAWKRGFGSVDVYTVPVSKVSKHFHGGYLEQGAFAIAGERKWFKNTLLKLWICFEEEKGVYSLPDVFPTKPRFSVEITPGKLEKNTASKAIKLQLQKVLYAAGKRLKIEDEEIAKALPGNVDLVNLK